MESLYSIRIDRKNAKTLLTDNGLNFDPLALEKLVFDTSKFLRLDRTSRELIEHLIKVILLRKARKQSKLTNGIKLLTNVSEGD